MAAAGVGTFNPLGLLQTAFSLPADSDEQAKALQNVRDVLEIAQQQDGVIRQWFFELLWFGIAQANLPPETRAKLALDCLDQLLPLLFEQNTFYVKLAIQTFATAYPLIFRECCRDRNARPTWDKLTAAKVHIVDITFNAASSTSLRNVSLKFVQRVILVDTRLNDPRLQNPNDPNIALVPADHPFIAVRQLEQESTQLIERCVVLFLNSTNVNTITGLVNSFGTMAKMRPNLMELFLTTLATWNGSQLISQPVSAQKSANKAIRIVLIHLSRLPQGAALRQKIDQAINVIDDRIRAFARMEEQRRLVVLERKRPYPASPDEIVPSGDAKRMRLDHDQTPTFRPVGSEILANFDFSSLTTAAVTDIIVGSLKLLPEATLKSAIETYHRNAPTASGPSKTQRAPPTEPAADRKRGSAAPLMDEAVVVVKEEPIDPLNMDLEEEAQIDLEVTASQLNQEVSQSDFSLHEFKLPALRPLTIKQKSAMAQSALQRVRKRGEESLAAAIASSTAVTLDGSVAETELWMLLIVRIITRGAYEPGEEEEEEKVEGESTAIVKAKNAPREATERMRRILCNYVLGDFANRSRLGLIWLNEEWFNDGLRARSNSHIKRSYDYWMNEIVSTQSKRIDAKDKVFLRFLLDLPSLPPDLIELLRSLALEPERMQVGFNTLRELVAVRPPMRTAALQVLLELTTHPEKVTRGAAIITVKRWVPDLEPMNTRIREFARQLLNRLRITATDETGDSMAGIEPAVISCSPYLAESIALPAEKPQILQHVELLFALSVKVPEFLDELFQVYPHLESSVQEAIQDLITALIKSLGPSHPRLLSLIRNYPDGAENLALRTLHIFTDGQRATPGIVNLVKYLIAERGADARFLMLIIAEMDKAEIMKHLPRLVSMLNGTPERKAMVKAAFISIVIVPPQTFINSNQPRVRQSELLTPAELMMFLHDVEKDVGLKQAIEAIGICFSMTDVYRSEVLAVVMQQIVDEPVLPVLFLRTVMQAVATYKSLIPFVCSTLLSRLITKKVWTNPQLWEGFIRCAKQTEPSSFDALLQLPKEQLRDLVEKQPVMKGKLREYVLKKAGNKGNKTRLAGFLEVLGEGPPEGQMVTDGTTQT